MINMIVAISRNCVIGKDGTLPWHIKEDLQTFKRLTMGGVLFVGKNTAKTLPPLKEREVVILDRTNFPTLTDLNDKRWKDKTKWIIGGSAIYTAALKLGVVDKIYLTMIDEEYDGDTYFSFDQMVYIEAGWKLDNKKVLREANPLVTLQEWIKV